MAYAHYREASIASYQRDVTEKRRYLPWLRARVDEFPDGHLLAYLGKDCVGQLELQVPYGMSSGYVNLFYVSAPFRRQGLGRQLQARAEAFNVSNALLRNFIQIEVAWKSDPEAGTDDRVQCVVKDESADPDRRIQALGGVRPDGTPWKLDIAAAIARRKDLNRAAIGLPDSGPPPNVATLRQRPQERRPMAATKRRSERRQG